MCAIVYVFMQVRDLMKDSSVNQDLIQNNSGERTRSESTPSVDRKGINQIQRGILDLPLESPIKDKGWQLRAAALAPQLALAAPASAVPSFPLAGKFVHHMRTYTRGK